MSSARVCRRKSHWAGSARRTTSLRRCCFSRVRPPATSPAKRSMSTAACICPKGAPVPAFARKNNYSRIRWAPCGRWHLRGRSPTIPRPRRPPADPRATKRHKDHSLMSTVEQQVKAIVAEQLGVKQEQVTNDASFVDDLGADSLDTVELVMALEEEFEIEIPDEDAEKITTVHQAIDYINERRNKA